MNKKPLIQLFRLIISSTFIFSAISKMITLNFFNDLVAELFLGKNYDTTSEALYYIQILTAGLIAFEILLGALVMQTKNLKKVILPTIQLLLLAFTLHLVYVSFNLMSEGKSFTEAFVKGNCGCFGDILPMTNLESILKNLVSMFLVGYLWLNVDKLRRNDIRFKSYVLPFIIGLITFGSLLLTVKEVSSPDGDANIIIYPSTEAEINKLQEDSLTTPKDTVIKPSTSSVDSSKKQNEQKEEKSSAEKKPGQKNPVTQKTVQAKPKEQPKPTYIDLLNKYSQLSDGVKTDFGKGKKMVCMFSLSCQHCQGTYKQLCKMTSSGKLPNTYLLNSGTKFEENFFFNQAGCKHPNVRIEDYLEFKRVLNGNAFPYIIYLEEGKIVKSWKAEYLEDPNNSELSNTDQIKNYFGIEDPKPIANPSPFSPGESSSPWE